MHESVTFTHKSCLKRGTSCIPLFFSSVLLPGSTSAHHSIGAKPCLPAWCLMPPVFFGLACVTFVFPVGQQSSKLANVQRIAHFILRVTGADSPGNQQRFVGECCARDRTIFTSDLLRCLFFLPSSEVYAMIIFINNRKTLLSLFLCVTFRFQCLHLKFIHVKVSHIHRNKIFFRPGCVGSFSSTTTYTEETEPPTFDSKDRDEGEQPHSRIHGQILKAVKKKRCTGTLHELFSITTEKFYF